FANYVAAVDVSSEVKGKQAHLRVRLAHQLDRDKFALGYRILRRGEVTDRRRIQGVDFQWDADADAQLGSIAIDVGEGDILHCFASYDGVAQHFYWLSDRSTT